MSAQALPIDWRRWARIAIQVFLTLWAGLWTAFAVLSYVSESVSLGGFVHLAKFMLLLLVPLIAAWLRPRVGGVLLVAAGAYDAHLYHHAFVWAVLVAPAVVGGLTLILLETGSGGHHAQRISPSE
jgi:hypothetical protein